MPENELLSKLGFLILIAAFGVLAVMSGLTMPQSLRQKLPVLPHGLAKQFPALSKLTLPALPGKKAAAPVAAKAQAKKPPPPPIESLMIPSPLPAKGSYGLQLGLYPEKEGAQGMAARVNGFKLPGIGAKTMEIQGGDGKTWFVAYAGEAGNPSDLEATKLRLEDLLSLQSLRPILIPQPKA